MRISSIEKILTWCWVGIVIPFIILAPNVTSIDELPPRHVLFIIMDDLRGANIADFPILNVMPHLRELTNRSYFFPRSYAQQAICNPSRASLLTGQRPSSTGITDLEHGLRSRKKNMLTLPQYLASNGFKTVGLGKIFHSGLDDPVSWTEPTWQTSRPLSLTRGTATSEHPINLGPSWYEYPNELQAELPDVQLTAKAIQVLEAHQSHRQERLFLAVGFRSPHLPFVAPQKYFEIIDSLKLTTPSQNRPEGAPPIALDNWGELRLYGDIPWNGPISSDQATSLVRGYLAACAFVDFQLEMLLETLRRLNLAESTLVVILGDHGFHLGEAGLWAKHTNFEEALQVPLVFHIPGSSNFSSERIVELLDVFPTTIDVLGLPRPPDLEGKDLFEGSSKNTAGQAFSEAWRGENRGFSIRTEQFRYTEWRNPKNELMARELYDFAASGEEKNIVRDPRLKPIIKYLSDILESERLVALRAAKSGMFK